MPARVKYTCEFPLRCSPHVLYDFLITPNGLGEWFAERVDQLEHEYTFAWEDSEERAILIESEREKFVRFRWDWMTKGEYFEFAIEKSDLTGNTILVITDFAIQNEIADQSALWEAQVHELKHRIGN